MAADTVATDGASTPAALGAAPTVLFLNRCAGGCSITQDFTDDSRANHSLVPDFSQSNVAAWNKSDEDWDATVSCVRDLFAPFNIKVVDEDPGQAPHHEAIVAGQPTDIFDLNVTPDAQFYGGIAPLGCGGGIPNSMSYVFANYVDDLEFICGAVGQEVGHTFGIDHLLACDDPMTYLPYCGPKAFQDQDATCGEDQARSCSCTNGATQNSYRIISQMFGTNEPPSVHITSHVDGGEMAVGDVLQVEATDDGGVTKVELYIDNQLVATSETAPFDITIPRIGGGERRVEVQAYDERLIAGTDSIQVRIAADAPGGDEGGEVSNDLQGGCSTGGSSSTGAAALLLLALAGLSRRRSQRARQRP